MFSVPCVKGRICYPAFIFCTDRADARKIAAESGAAMIPKGAELKGMAAGVIHLDLFRRDAALVTGDSQGKLISRDLCDAPMTYPGARPPWNGGNPASK